MSSIGWIFNPISCRERRLNSRIIFSPINTGYTRNNRPTQRLVRFHRDRSGREIGVSIVGNVAVEPESGTNARTAVLSRESDVPRFAVLARAISQKGSLPGIQLASAPPALAPQRRWIASNKLDERGRLADIVLSLTDADLKAKLNSFLNAAVLSKKAGYGLIQIHAAHGYLLSLLLHPEINLRKGYYSAFGEWYGEFIQSLRSIVGDSLLSIRISAIIGFQAEDEEIGLTVDIVRRSAAAGVDMVDLSAGFYTIDRRLIYPGKKWNRPVFYQWMNQLSNVKDCFVVISGRITDLLEVRDLPDNVLLGVGRALIADPQFASKSLLGHGHAINKCALRSCCHYYTKGRSELECCVNPDI